MSMDQNVISGIAGLVDDSDRNSFSTGKIQEILHDISANSDTKANGQQNKTDRSFDSPAQESAANTSSQWTPSGESSQDHGEVDWQPQSLKLDEDQDKNMVDMWNNMMPNPMTRMNMQNMMQNNMGVNPGMNMPHLMNTLNMGQGMNQGMPEQNMSYPLLEDPLAIQQLASDPTTARAALMMLKAAENKIREKMGMQGGAVSNPQLLEQLAVQTMLQQQQVQQAQQQAQVQQVQQAQHQQQQVHNLNAMSPVGQMPRPLNPAALQIPQSDNVAPGPLMVLDSMGRMVTTLDPQDPSVRNKVGSNGEWGVSPMSLASPQPGHGITPDSTRTNQNFQTTSPTQGQKVDPELFKVKMCRTWLLSNKCAYGSRCVYAHSPSELRTREVNLEVIKKVAGDGERCKVDPAKFKVKMCAKWEQFGVCPYSPHCMFAHGDHELRSVMQNKEAAKRLGALIEKTRD